MSHTQKTSQFRTALIAIAVPALLILVGAGCMRLGNKKTPETKPVMIEDPDAAARANEESDRTANDLSVGMILTENAAVPPGATLLPGRIGCNDRAVYQKIHRESSTDNVLADALATLFSVKESSIEKYYNALWQSSLKVEKIQSTDGVTTEVWLKGEIASGGVCDDPRIKAQIEATILRLKPKFTIFLNGKESNYRCIGDMSGECK